MAHICERIIQLQAHLKGATSKKNYLRGFEEREKPHFSCKIGVVAWIQSIS